MGSFGIADRIEGSQDFLAEPGGLLEDCLDRVGIEMRIGRGAQELLDAENLE
jgi:hypothetical protein